MRLKAIITPISLSHINNLHPYRTYVYTYLRETFRKRDFVVNFFPQKLKTANYAKGSH